GLCPIRGDPGPGLRRTPGNRAPAGPHPQAASARHRGGIALGRHQLADRRHVRAGRSRSAAARRRGARRHQRHPEGLRLGCEPCLADGFATAPSRTAAQDEAIAQALGRGRPTLSESESKQLLSAWGVASAREHLINSAEEAVAAAERLGFPVALKVDSPDILHKTEAGVVRLNLGDAAQVRTAYAEILASAKAYSKALP